MEKKQRERDACQATHVINNNGKGKVVMLRG